MSERVPAALRRRVRERAQRRCEYCLLHEDDALLPPEPDHIIATKHGGATTESNLAWACFGCNRLKASDVASIDNETGRVVRLVHPRNDRWLDHFRLEDGRIVPLTPEGRATEHLLQFNLTESVETRKLLMRTGRYSAISEPSD